MWLAAVLLCNVEEIVLSILCQRYITLNSSVFLCKTLVILKLNMQGHLDIPSCVWLPRLRTLHLKGVKFQDDKSISRLITGCPVLEELKLCECIGDAVGEVNIRAPALTSLIIEDLRSFSYETIVDAPALVYLKIEDGKADLQYELKNLYNLLEAVIDIGPDFQDKLEDYEESREDCVKAITNLLNGVSHVQRLVLSWRSLQIIQWCDVMPPTFSKLTCMKVTTSCHIGWGLLPILLKNSPRLETLHLKQVTNLEVGESEFEDGENYVLFEDVATCLVSHLKIIQIDEFRGLKDETQMVEYFLHNAKVRMF